MPIELDLFNKEELQGEGIIFENSFQTFEELRALNAKTQTQKEEIPEEQEEFQEEELNPFSSQGPRFKYSPPTSTTQYISYLDSQIQGNTRVKKLFANSLKNLEKRINYPHLELPKTNMLFIGETGSGKTHSAKIFAQSTGLPFLETKLTGASIEGYEGRNISSVFEQLKIPQEEGGFGLPITSNYSIVYLDEIDKIAQTSSRNASFGLGLQDELIGLIEESRVVQDILSTKNMLFIGTGAFVGLDEIIEERISQQEASNSIGFMADISPKKASHYSKEELLKQVIPQDLIEYGLKPELVGRFPLIGNLEPLTQKSLVGILNLETSYLSKQQEVFKQAYDVDLTFTYPAKVQLAKYALQQKTNARGLQGAIDKVLVDYHLYPERISNKSLKITKEEVNKILL